MKSDTNTNAYKIVMTIPIQSSYHILYSAIVPSAMQEDKHADYKQSVDCWVSLCRNHEKVTNECQNAPNKWRNSKGIMANIKTFVVCCG